MHRVIRQIKHLTANPFPHDQKEWDRSADSLRRHNLVQLLGDLLKDRDEDGVMSLVLAIGHTQACANPDAPQNVLDRATIPDKLWRKMPYSRESYLRIVMAAGRCFAALRCLQGDSELMQKARRQAWSACFGDSLVHSFYLEPVIRDHDVLILGETGTGKEGFAKAVQMATPGDSDGLSAPASTINAAAIPDTLVESELFGHVRGAFTGASDTRKGRIRSADGGSFFLDEVGDLPPTTQVKLLRVIESNEVFPLGSDKTHHVELRYIAATHKDLEAMVSDGSFRRDLFQRLAGIVIEVPPLRERPGDIVGIGTAFLRSYLGDSDIPKEALTWLQSQEAQNYRWPGNVRELQNALRSLLLGLRPDLDMPDELPTGVFPSGLVKGNLSLNAAQHWYMKRVVEAHDGNLSRAAQVLGIDRSTLRRRLKELA